MKRVIKMNNEVQHEGHENETSEEQKNSQQDHQGHEDHRSHHEMMIVDFKRRFFISMIVTGTILIF